MLQIKTFPPLAGDDAINAFLATLNKEDVIKVDVQESGFAVIQYEVKEPWTNKICCDCKYFDDGGDSSSVGGLCMECGGRRRFNCKACDRFKDVRG